MLAKTFIAGCTLLLVHAVGGAKQAISAVAAKPSIDAPGGTPHGKPLAEDPGSWRREPFKSPEPPPQRAGSPPRQEPAAAAPELALQGIMKSNKRCYAIINGRTVRTGDRIDGWTVAEIGRQSVTVRREREKQIYDIYQGRTDRGTK